jgi:hypothetical protein
LKWLIGRKNGKVFNFILENRDKILNFNELHNIREVKYSLKSSGSFPKNIYKGLVMGLFDQYRNTVLSDIPHNKLKYMFWIKDHSFISIVRAVKISL